MCCVIQHDSELREDLFARRDVEWQRDDELCEVVLKRRGVVWSIMQVSVNVTVCCVTARRYVI